MIYGQNHFSDSDRGAGVTLGSLSPGQDQRFQTYGWLLKGTHLFIGLIIFVVSSESSPAMNKAIVLHCYL